MVTGSAFTAYGQMISFRTHTGYKSVELMQLIRNTAAASHQSRLCRSAGKLKYHSAIPLTATI